MMPTGVGRCETGPGYERYMIRANETDCQKIFPQSGKATAPSAPLGHVGEMHEVTHEA